MKNKIKLLKESIQHLHDIGVGIDFSNRTQIANHKKKMIK